MNVCRIDRERGPRAASRTPQEQALAEAFTQVAPELTTRQFLILGNWEEAHDAAQAAFLKCWACRDQLAAVRDLRGWVFRVGLNVALDRRRQMHRRQTVSLESLGDSVAVPGKGTEEEVLQRERLQLLQAALGQLRPAEREVFVLRLTADLTYAEIADARHQPEATVKTLMRAAVRKLREQLACEP